VTIRQLYLFDVLGLLLTIVAAVLTRASGRRIAGAVAGAGGAGILALLMAALWQRVDLWRFSIAWEPYYLVLLWTDFVVFAYVFLITWRIARRFGRRGLLLVVCAAALVGPARDYWYLKKFPEWGSYAPGVLPLLAVSVTYVVIILAGHGLMRLVAGPAGADSLTRSWRTSAPRGV
jgi:hypothetical protein